jgi:hypothetical protein
MNGFAAIDSVHPFCFWADKAAVAADFHLGTALAIMGKRKIASTAGVCTLCDFCKNQLRRFCEKFEIFDLLAKMQSSVASRARRYPHFIFAFNGNAISAKNSAFAVLPAKDRWS